MARLRLLLPRVLAAVALAAAALMAPAVPAGSAQAAPALQALEHELHLPVALADAQIARLPVPTAVPTSPTAAPTSPTTLTPTQAPAVTPTPTQTTPPAGYTEPITDHPDLSDLAAGYDPSRWYETLLEVLARRYTTGHYIVTHLENSKTNAQRWMAGRTSTFSGLLSAIGLAVHEMNHQLGWQEGLVKSGGQDYAYVVRDDLTVTVARQDTFNRSEIARYVTGPLANQYKAVYLEGRSGKQGFFVLLDEFNAYTHSLFTGYGLYDQFPRNRRVSDRDGVVTFMMYTQFYLRHAREMRPAVYRQLRSDPAVRDLVALLWTRAMFILDVTKDIGSLALDPAAVEAEMRKPDMLAEVEAFVAP